MVWRGQQAVVDCASISHLSRFVLIRPVSFLSSDPCTQPYLEGMSSRRDPLDRAIRNVKIAAFLAAIAACLEVARLILVLAHHR